MDRKPNRQPKHNPEHGGDHAAEHNPPCRAELLDWPDFLFRLFHPVAPLALRSLDPLSANEGAGSNLVFGQRYSQHLKLTASLTPM